MLKTVKKFLNVMAILCALVSVQTLVSCSLMGNSEQNLTINLPPLQSGRAVSSDRLGGVKESTKSFRVAIVIQKALTDKMPQASASSANKNSVYAFIYRKPLKTSVFRGNAENAMF